MSERICPHGHDVTLRPCTWCAREAAAAEQPRDSVCRSLTDAMLADVPCPDCGHRVGSHAIVTGGGACDVCSIIRAVRRG